MFEEVRKWVIGIIVVVVLLLGWKAWDGGYFGTRGADYQAVFLTNGQVYFGKFRPAMGKYAKLSDIYYLQVQQSVQPAQAGQTQQPQVSLVKLGNELHGPQDSMYIDREQILFWENMKEDGKVVKAIREYQKNPTQTQPAAQ
jgi:hypothetical protein